MMTVIDNHSQSFPNSKCVDLYSWMQVERDASVGKVYLKFLEVIETHITEAAIYDRDHKWSGMQMYSKSSSKMLTPVGVKPRASDFHALHATI